MTTIQEQRDRLEMDDLASALRRSVELTAEDFDGRERCGCAARTCAPA